MSCSNTSFNRVLTPDKRHFYTGIYCKRPCRWCLNCRIDKRNYWQDRLDYERLRMKSSAFVTFTYDDYRIPLNSYAQPTLCKKDFTKFIDRLQRQLNYHGLPEFCFSDWRYFAVGEYGDQFGRPHYHCLFFGLDFWTCRNIFLRCWKSGLIDSLPILDGGIRYVLKYLDKQLFGEEKKKAYTAKEIEAPFSSLTPSIGSELFIDQLDFIRQTGTYKNLAGKVRPINPYYRDLFGAPSAPVRVEQKLRDFRLRHPDSPLKDYDVDERQLLYARECYFADKMLQEGYPALRPVFPTNENYGAVRNMMFSEYQKTKVHDYDLINNHVLQKLYELRGVTL